MRMDTGTITTIAMDVESPASAGLVSCELPATLVVGEYAVQVVVEYAADKFKTWPNPEASESLEVQP